MVIQFLPRTQQVAGIVESDSLLGTGQLERPLASGAIAHAPSLRVFPAGSLASALALIDVLLSVGSANGSVFIGATVALVFWFLPQHLPLADESVSRQLLSLLNLLFLLNLLSLLFSHSVDEIPEQFLLGLEGIDFLSFFTFSEVSEGVLEASNGTEISVGESPLSTDGHVDVGAVVAGEFDGGTLPVTGHLDAHAVEGALVVVGESIHSADWSVLLLAVTGTQAGALAEGELADAVEQALVLVGESGEPADWLEDLVLAVAGQEGVVLFEGEVSAGARVREGDFVFLHCAHVEIGHCVLSADWLVNLRTVLFFSSRAGPVEKQLHSCIYESAHVRVGAHVLSTYWGFSQLAN